MFEKFRHEQSLILLRSPTDREILKQSKLTDLERNIIKNLPLEKLHKQETSKEYFAHE